jgi:group II intron reverse transcriptase/maturase
MGRLLSEITKEENLRRAFHRVESARTRAGVDGVTLNDWRRNLEENLRELARDLSGRTYRSLPLLCVLSARADGSPKPLFIPTVRDRTAQASVVNVIEPIMEILYEDDPYPHRKTGCVRHAAQRVKELWESGHGYLVDASIATFFDGIDHDTILGRLRDSLDDVLVVDLVKEWLKAEVYDGERVFRLEMGIACGTVPAPTLAKLCLDLLAESLGFRGQQLVRYADDMVVLAKTADHAVNGMEISPEILSGLTLTLDPEDPRIPEFWKELEVMGFLFSGDAILTPFDRWPPPRIILYTPPPFNLETYLRDRH